MKVLITGGSGFLGKTLANKLKSNYKVILCSRNNGNNYQAHLETGCEIIPMDVSNINSVRDVVYEVSPDIIIHAAATKFVDLSEKNPHECIDVNIVGSQNVARIAIEKNVSYVIGISTDKAAPPVGNIYGHSKAVMERLFCSLNGKTDTVFSCVRFGNISWSTGSVFPIWSKMIEKEGIIQSTGPEMRRFFFTVDDAAELVIRAMKNKKLVAGKILSLKMKAAQIEDILNVWTKHFGASWKKISGRPGDKLDEYLIGDIEVPNTIEIELEKKTHYLIEFNKKFENHIPCSVSTLNAERLNEHEILEIIKAKP